MWFAELPHSVGIGCPQVGAHRCSKLGSDDAMP